MLAGVFLLGGVQGSPKLAGAGTQQEDQQQLIRVFTTGVQISSQKVEEFFAMLKEGERKRKELAAQNQENIRLAQEKARDAKEAAARLEEETRRKMEEVRIRQEEARMFQKEQLRMLQDRMRR